MHIVQFPFKKKNKIQYDMKLGTVKKNSLLEIIKLFTQCLWSRLAMWNGWLFTGPVDKLPGCLCGWPVTKGVPEWTWSRSLSVYTRSWEDTATRLGPYQGYLVNHYCLSTPIKCLPGTYLIYLSDREERGEAHRYGPEQTDSYKLSKGICNKYS